MACLTCGEKMSQNQVTLIEMYKNAHLITGKVYWVLRENSTNKINIHSNESFKNFKEQNKADFKKKKYEFIHISEFRGN